MHIASGTAHRAGRRRTDPVDPGGERCFYFFPGTRVASSDAHSFALQAYSVDAIMCGDSVVWVNRDLVQRALPLTDKRRRSPSRSFSIATIDKGLARAETF